MIISMDAEKHLTKFNIQDLTKLSNKTDYIDRRKYNSNIIKYVFNKPISNIILNSEKLIAFPQDQEQVKDFQSYHFFFNISTRIPSQKTRQNKEIKGIQI